MQWVQEACFLGRKVDHSPLYTVQVMNKWCYTSTSSIRLAQEHLNLLPIYGDSFSCRRILRIAVFWYLTPCGLINNYKCPRKICYFHLQYKNQTFCSKDSGSTFLHNVSCTSTRPHCVTSQKTDSQQEIWFPTCLTRYPADCTV